MLQKEFKDQPGFHNRLLKNQSTLVYDTKAGGSYVEAAINSWGISDEKLVTTAASRIKNKVSSSLKLPWPPSIDKFV